MTCRDIPSHDKPHVLPGSSNARQECMSPRVGKDTVCISYNEMMSIYPGVSKIYTACGCVHLLYPCIVACVSKEKLRLSNYVANLMTVTKTNMINEMPCGYGTLITTCVGIWRQVFSGACAEVSPSLKVSCRPAQRSQQL
jgi:hypothetical protein